MERSRIHALTGELAYAVLHYLPGSICTFLGEFIRTNMFMYAGLLTHEQVNGDPSNDNINGTFFEHDINSNQMRHGGDIQGLVDTLDYLQGMGVRVNTRACSRSSGPVLTTITGFVYRRIPFHQSALDLRPILSPRPVDPRAAFRHHRNVADSNRRNARSRHVCGT